MIDNIKNEINNQIDEIYNNLDDHYSKVEIEQLINELRRKHDVELENLIATVDLNNTSTISRMNMLEARITAGEEGQQLFMDGVNVLVADIQATVNSVKSRMMNVENEVISPEPEGILNSRIDKLEAAIEEIKENGYAPQDKINNIEWINCEIVDRKSQYITGETFEIHKGNVIVHYNDDTQEDVTNEAIFNITGGTLNDNVVTVGNNEGNFQITVTYKDHQSNEKLTYKVVIPKYYNYFLLVDDVHLNDVSNNLNEYYINRSTGCPMSSSTNYSAYNLIINKFYNDIEQNLNDNKLYMIIPTTYARLDNGILYISNKSLKSNIFDINGITLYDTFTVNEECYNISGYNTKEIEYSIFLISDSINKGIQLNY